MDPFSIASLGLQGIGAVTDLINGGAAARRQKRLFEQYQADMARREQKTLALEAIARGEIRVSLEQGKQLYRDALQSLTSSGNAAMRTATEQAAYRDAQTRVGIQRSGMLGGTAGSVAQSMTERERLRAQLDASGARGGSLAQLLSSQAQFEMNGANAIANSYRNEANITDMVGQRYQSALENTQVQFNPIGPALGKLAGSLETINPNSRRAQLEQAYIDLLNRGSVRMNIGGSNQGSSWNYNEAGTLA